LKRAEQKLRESEEEFHRITDVIAQGIVVLSADGTALDMNRVSIQKTGLMVEELSARSHFSSAFHPEDIERLASRELRQHCMFQSD
jgi:PAS domain S-box-containing protein